MTGPSRETSRSLAWIALALVVSAVIAHARVVLGGETWDDVHYHTEIAPARLAAADAVWSGRFPEWWDGTGLGVPLLAEPCHGAMTVTAWAATTPRALDLSAWVHLVWAALGVAFWARGAGGERTRAGASEVGALVAALLVVTSGALTSGALRGELPALVHLPWIGAAAGALAREREVGRRRLLAAGLGVLLGLTGLAGHGGAFVDALALALVIGARRDSWRVLAAAVGIGLAIASAQWIPAALWIAERDRVGSTVDAIPPSRLLELILPGTFGSPDPSRSLPALAGERAWAPSLYVGAPLLALASIGRPGRRAGIVLVVFAVLAVIGGRGPWPAWLGAPDTHVIAAMLVLAPAAGLGVDALSARSRRALVALGAATVVSLLALAVLAAIRSEDTQATIDRALVDGALGGACLIAALAVSWRWPGRSLPVALALVVLPGFGAMRSNAPTTDRTPVVEPSAWATAGRVANEPRRLFRPVHLTGTTSSVRDAMATLRGASGWRWGIAAARSTDAARPVTHDRVWLAAAREGGALLDRYGIELAILPVTLLVPRKLASLGERGEWALTRLPVAPVASVLRGARWAIDPEDALAHLFTSATGTNVLRGTVVLRGRGEPRNDKGPPLPCEVTHWRPGDQVVRCTSDLDGYAVISSGSAPGWSVAVDGVERPPLVADVLRRAVRVDAGTHVIAWRYAAPGLIAGGVLAAAGLLAALVLIVLARPRGRASRA